MWYSGFVHDFQKRNKWVVRYDDGEVKTHNLTVHRWEYEYPPEVAVERQLEPFEEPILPIGFFVKTLYDIGRTKKWFLGHIIGVSKQEDEISYNVEYLPHYPRHVDSFKQTFTPENLYPIFEVKDPVQSQFLEDDGVYVWYEGRVVRKESDKYYNVLYSDNTMIRMDARQLFPLRRFKLAVKLLDY